MADFSAIPIHILKQELNDVEDDIVFCTEALKFDVLKDDDDRSIHYRLDWNKHMKQIIEAELERRPEEGVIQ
jgi:hypothetical protein